MSRGRTYPGSTVVHSPGCACPLPKCDPTGAKLAAARAAALAAKGAPPAEVAAAVVAPPRPSSADRLRAAARRADVDRNTRRLRELLKAGRTFSEAAQIIESETKGGSHA